MSGMKRRAIPWRLLGIIVVMTGASYLVPLANFRMSPGFDWRQMASFPLLTATSVLIYNRLPLHDPWVCGGLDQLSNPQTRIFSPLGWLALLFNPDLANLLSLVILGFFGALGFYVLARDLKASRATSLVCAFLFVNCGWFTLHFVEGHIAFGSMQLFPWLVYCALNLASPARLLGLSTLMAFFLLDGGVYAFIFGLYYLAFGACLGLVKVGRPGIKPKFAALSLASFALLSAPKVIPVLYVISGRVPEIDDIRIPWRSFATVFLNPLHTNRDTLPFNETLRFHEFGCYLGVPLLACLAWAAARARGFLSRAWRWLVLAAVWFWIGTGLGGVVNPWRLFQKIPLANNAHVQTRVLIFLVLALLVALVFALEALRRRRLAFALVAALLVAESLFVRTFVFVDSYRHGYHLIFETNVVPSWTLWQTVPMAVRPEHYFWKNAGSKECYERSAPETNVRVSGEENYRGEVYLEGNTGPVTLIYFFPGEVRIKYRSSRDTAAIVNTNYITRWTVTEGPGQAYRTSDGLLGIKLPAASALTTVTVKYDPPYLPWVLVLFSLGIALWAWLVVRVTRPKRRRA
jgi:hypothetical protein